MSIEENADKLKAAGFNPPIDWEAMHRLSKDLRNAGALLTDREARYFVDAYYTIQKLRVRSNNQVKALQRDVDKMQEVDPDAKEEPHSLLDWLNKNQRIMEDNLKATLGKYANSRPAGVWAQSICGIAGVLSAGLLAHIDLNPWKCANEDAEKSCREGAPCTPLCGKVILHTAGHIWRFAGLDPTSKWEPKTKRPWNASLKTLCWKIGESFVKVKNSDNDVYGKVYQYRREYEEAKNNALEYKAQADEGARRVKKSTDAYKVYITGKLPDGHLHSRAKRYAVKLFLAHFHHVSYEIQFKSLPPKPYIIEHGGHAHYIAPPNWPMK